jgi:hypothetical protein
MASRPEFFFDVFTQLNRLSSDPHWQRALDIARKWRQLSESRAATQQTISRLTAQLENESWNGPLSLWRQMTVEFSEWARGAGFHASTLEPEETSDGAQMSFRDIVDHTILYYFPSSGNLATESRRGLFVALRWKRLLDADQVTQTDVDGVLGALDAGDSGVDTESYCQWTYLRNQITSWAENEGFLVSENTG